MSANTARTLRRIAYPKPPVEMPAADERETAAPVATAPPRPGHRRRRGWGLMLSALLAIGLPTAIGTVYYLWIAADQYVSEFKFSVRSAERFGEAGAAASTAMIGGMVAEAFVVTEFINSRQMAAEVAQAVDLTKIYAHPRADFLSRMGESANQEQRYEYWRRMVSAHFDMLTGIVTVTVRAFTPQDAVAVARAVVRSADQMVLKMSERARQDGVRFAEEEVQRAEADVKRVRGALRDFRVQERILDAGQTAQAGSQLLSKLREELSRMNSEVATMSSYMSPTAPQIQVLKTRIRSTEAEIARMSAAIGGDGKGGAGGELSSSVMAQFDSLNTELELLQKSYSAALEGLQKARANADRRTSYLTVFVDPVEPQSSLYPQRLQAIAIVALIASAIWFLATLVVASIRDHLL